MYMDSTLPTFPTRHSRHNERRQWRFMRAVRTNSKWRISDRHTDRTSPISIGRPGGRVSNAPLLTAALGLGRRRRRRLDVADGGRAQPRLEALASRDDGKTDGGAVGWRAVRDVIALSAATQYSI